MKKIIIIHGWTYTIEPWTETVRQLTDKGYEIEQLRVPGLTEPSDRVWTINDYVAWLKSKLADQKDITVLGHSNGGRIAMNYLATYPDAFERLILLNAAGIYYPEQSQSLKRKVIRLIAKIGKPLAKVPLLSKVFYRFIGSDYGRAPENMKQTLANMLESDKTFDASRVKATNVNLLWGKEDRTTPVGLGRKIHQQIVGSTIQEFDGWTHAPYITHPAELTNAIDRVVKS